MSVLILGAGYVGERLRAVIPDAFATRRSVQTGALRFDLADASTWSALPAAETVIWTFPAAPAELAMRFRTSGLSDAKRLIVLGSTSAYLSTEADGWIDEATPLDLTQSRVAGEETLRAAGATVLRLAGIWGPGRDPVRWLLDGRIRNGRKFVNLAHVDDVLAAIVAAISSPVEGQVINVSDGEPRRWSDHVERLKELNRLPPDFALSESDPGLESKQVRADRLRALLPAGRAFIRLT